MANDKKVMVSGCFDLFHAGHLEFLMQASAFGDLYVVIGTDASIRMLKDVDPTYNQEERAFIIGNLKPVEEAMIATGSGMLDFRNELAAIRPDYFVVNEDGHTPGKRELCRSLGVEYVVLKREPHPGLPRRSSTELRAKSGRHLPDRHLPGRHLPGRHLPYRLCLAGGWIDQPYVNRYGAGSATVVRIEYRPDLFAHSGLATSTRKVWSDLVGKGLRTDLPAEELAFLLYHVENGRELTNGYRDPAHRSGYLSGSQDHIGLTHAGVSRLDYDHGVHKGYWPMRVESTTDAGVCQWLQEHLVLVPIGETPAGYDPLAIRNFTPAAIRELGAAGRDCYDAILRRDLDALGRCLTRTHDTWREILPLSTDAEIDAALGSYDELGTGRTTSHSGGGYAIIATDRDVREIPRGFRVRVKRE